MVWFKILPKGFPEYPFNLRLLCCVVDEGGRGKIQRWSGGSIWKRRQCILFHSKTLGWWHYWSGWHKKNLRPLYICLYEPWPWKYQVWCLQNVIGRTAPVWAGKGWTRSCLGLSLLPSTDKHDNHTGLVPGTELGGGIRKTQNHIVSFRCVCQSSCPHFYSISCLQVWWLGTLMYQNIKLMGQWCNNQSLFLMFFNILLPISLPFRSLNSIFVFFLI